MVKRERDSCLRKHEARRTGEESTSAGKVDRSLAAERCDDGEKPEVRVNGGTGQTTSVLSSAIEHEESDGVGQS